MPSCALQGHSRRPQHGRGPPGFKHRFLVGLILAFGCLLAVTGASSDDESSSSKEKKVAIVTLVTTSTYIPGALVLAESLQAVKAKGDRVLLWVGPEDDPRSDMTPDRIAELKEYWDETRQLTKADGSYTECQISEQHKTLIQENPTLKGLDRYWGTCSKFAVWGLVDYDVVVYMDADSVALHNFDFVFDYLDTGEAHFAAHGVPECWDTNPPQFLECNFYTAFFVIKPLPHVQSYFHQLASKQYLAEGEITLLNQVIQQWKPLPRFTLVAQTEAVRPMADDGKTMDWSQAKVYDFAGNPDTKPWMSHALAKQYHDPNWHAYFGSMVPGTEGYNRYMVPQKIWNDYYDKVLAKKEKKQKATKEEL
ncbi:Sulfolipid biosynthesis protein [Seminavis robusta]|uniref:Sulfolipid biosynthesis protein n=1 Tax=Seminavis robusta TaxID=568900 RepID=A0A9N8DBJ9_9STRA|nr:Sulfolipid biosynthesis protein [Seminavis robusta]|eukprot:Sro24_g016600.1 Sulfolipid biosynthesis protein (365) ;mRNA; r:152554-153648